MKQDSIKKYIILCVVFILASTLVYAKPKAGFGIIRGFSSEEMFLATLLRQHIINIAASLQIFDSVNPENLARQQQRYACYDEQCMLLFTREMGLSLFVIGKVSQTASGYRVHIAAYGLDIPYNGKEVCSYTATVKGTIMDKSDREASYIAEEIASQFIVLLCQRFQVPAYISHNTVVSDFTINGTFTCYTVEMLHDDFVSLKPMDNVTIVNNIVAGNGVYNDCMVLIDFKKEAEAIQQFYYGRKQEIVFNKAAWEDSCSLIAFTIPASATMPVVVPFFGYYANEDYEGLLLWIGNVVPYTGMQMWGLTHKPDTMKKHHEDISRHDRALYYFGWYMLFVGGMPSFVDSFSHSYLEQARYYKGKVSTMGDKKNEVYLSLLGGGSGMFYKGYRAWGYWYFHITNLCVYGLLYNYARPSEWDSAHNRYIKHDANKSASYAFLSLLSVIKIVEMIHTLSVPYTISVVEQDDSRIEVLPVFAVDDYEKITGIACAMHF